MKRLAAPIIAVFLLLPAQRADALFGIGLKYVSDSFSVGEWTDGDDFFTLTGAVSYTHLTLPTILLV